MNKLKFLSLLFLLICGICSGQQPENNDFEGWKLSKDKDGILVYTKQVEDSKLKKFLAVTIIQAPKEAIIDLINDVENKVEWMSNLSSAKVIKKISDTEHIDYYESEIPWPIKNKDIVMHFKLEEENSGSVFINYSRGKHAVLTQVGGLRVNYNHWGEIVNTRGQVNRYSNYCNYCGVASCSIDHSPKNRHHDDHDNYNDDDVYRNDSDFYYYKQNGKVKKHKKGKKNKR